MFTATDIDLIIPR